MCPFTNSDEDCSQLVANWAAANDHPLVVNAAAAAGALGALLDATFGGGNACAGQATAGGQELVCGGMPAVGGGASGAVRTEAQTLAEQLTLEEAKAGAGTEIMKDQLKDPARAGGWSKMQHTHTNPDGTTIVIHYWKELKTGVMELFKFKNP